MKQSIEKLFQDLDKYTAEELHSIWLSTDYGFLQDFLGNYLEYYHFQAFVELEQIRIEEDKAEQLIDLRE